MLIFLNVPNYFPQCVTSLSFCKNGAKNRRIHPKSKKLLLFSPKHYAENVLKSQGWGLVWKALNPLQ